MILFFWIRSHPKIILAQSSCFILSRCERPLKPPRRRKKRMKDEWKSWREIGWRKCSSNHLRLTYGFGETMCVGGSETKGDWPSRIRLWCTRVDCPISDENRVRYKCQPFQCSDRWWLPDRFHSNFARFVWCICRWAYCALVRRIFINYLLSKLRQRPSTDRTWRIFASVNTLPISWRFQSKRTAPFRLRSFRPTDRPECRCRRRLNWPRYWKFIAPSIE